MTLTEGKQLLANVQRCMVQKQVEAYIAQQLLQWMRMNLEVYEEEEILHRKQFRRLCKAVDELETYITLNEPFIPNYGERHRYGEPISTAFVESTVNEVISWRMVKKQQMRWTQKGAHLLLQVRTRALNGDLKDTFCGWYPGMASTSTNELSLAAWVGVVLTILLVGLWVFYSHQLAWPIYAIPYVILAVVAYREAPLFFWVVG